MAIEMDNFQKYSSQDFNALTQFQQEEITNNYKQAILYKMKENKLDIAAVAGKMGIPARKLSELLYSDTVNYETHEELHRILAIVNSWFGPTWEEI